MKKSQKKYAQLVEAQSPEPAELVEGQSIVGQVLLPTLEEVGNAQGCGKSDSDANGIPPVVDWSRPGEENPSSSAQLMLGSGASSSRDDLRQASAKKKTTTTTTRANISKQMGRKQAAKDRQLGSSLAVNDKELEARRASRSSSQISTSFISTGSQTLSSTASFVTTDQAQPSPRGSPRSSGRGTNLTRTISRSLPKFHQQEGKFEVSWRNLTFNYERNFFTSFGKSPAQVLRNISGGFRSNRLIAVIGPSGCGKTTLLQLLAGNHSANVNNLRIIGLEEPKVAFIGQGDCLLPGLTARETLIYASRLQNTKPNFDHEQHVEPILSQLGLTECADRSVTKLSGGQAKRVTIAQELLYPTNLLILDELTSGLDGSTSYSIVKMLKQLVLNQDYPMSIVMSIHQPSAKLFEVFDQVYVMSEGCCLYEGSCSMDRINTHLRRFGLECPKFNNMADFLIEIASEDLTNSPDGSKSIKERMIQFEQSKNRTIFDDGQQEKCLDKEANHQGGGADFQLTSVVVANKESFLINGIIADDEHDSDNENNEDDDEDEEESRKEMIQIDRGDRSLYKAIKHAREKRERPIYQQIQIHFRRSLLQIGRSKILTYLQLMTYLFSSLQVATFFGSDVGSASGCPKLPMSFVAFIFSDETDDNLTSEMRGAQMNMNFLLVSMMIATFAALEITVISFPLEAKTIKREWRNGWYRVSSYSIGRTLADLPFQLVFVCIFCVIIFTMTGQVGFATWRFPIFVLIIVLAALIAQTVGFIFGAIFMENLPAAVFIAPLCIFPSLLFSGFFSRTSEVPSYYRPITYLSHFRYAFDSLIITIYGFNRCTCDEEALVAYHASQGNQSSMVRDMFKSLFGSSDCISPNQEENSIDDSPEATSSLPNIFDPSKSDNNSIPLFLSASSTAMPLKSVNNALEDVLVNKMFEQMKGTTINDTATTILPSNEGHSAMDQLVHNFSHKITQMLNRQSNFGHEIPSKCLDSKSHLMSEFDLNDNDLIICIAVLFVFTIALRLLCNLILSVTISSRTT